MSNSNYKEYAGKRFGHHCLFCGELFYGPYEVPENGIDTELLDKLKAANIQHMKMCDQHPYFYIYNQHKDLLDYLRAGIDLQDRQLEHLTNWPMRLDKAVKVRDEVAEKLSHLDTQG